jgi:heme oxygenase
MTYDESYQQFLRNIEEAEAEKQKMVQEAYNAFDTRLTQINEAFAKRNVAIQKKALKGIK